MYEIYERLLALHSVTSADVCRETGISQSTISTWKKRRTVIGMKSAKKIADYFGIPVDVLMGNSDVRWDDATVASDENAFANYLKNLGWNHTVVSTLKSEKYHNLSNGDISVNVPDETYLEFEGKIRNECVDWVLGLVAASIQRGSLAAARPSITPLSDEDNDLGELAKKN